MVKTYHRIHGQAFLGTITQEVPRLHESFGKAYNVELVGFFLGFFHVSSTWQGGSRALGTPGGWSGPGSPAAGLDTLAWLPTPRSQLVTGAISCGIDAGDAGAGGGELRVS